MTDKNEFEKELLALQKQIVNLKDEKERIIETYRDRCAKIKDEIVLKANELNALKSTLTAEQKKRSDELDQFENDLKYQNIKANALADGLDKKKKKLDEFESALNWRRAEIEAVGRLNQRDAEKLQNEQASLGQARKDHEREVQAAKECNQEELRYLERKRDEFKKTEDSLKERETDLAYKMDELDKRQEKITKTEASNAARSLFLNQSESDLDARVEKLKFDSVDLKNEETELNGKLQSLALGQAESESNLKKAVQLSSKISERQTAAIAKEIANYLREVSLNEKEKELLAREENIKIIETELLKKAG